MLAYYFGFGQLWGLEDTPPVFLPAVTAQTSQAYAKEAGAPWPQDAITGDGTIRMSLFPIPSGVVCLRVQNHPEAGSPPVIIASDYSCWCPVCGFVNPEDTTVMSVLHFGGGS